MVCDLLQKIELFHAAGTQMVPPYGPDIVKSFYDILTVLDSRDWRCWPSTALSLPPQHLPLKKAYVDCTAPDRLDFSNEITRLATLVDWRTAYYRIARWFSMIAIPLFFILFWGSLNWTNRSVSEIHEPHQKTH